MYSDRSLGFTAGAPDFFGCLSVFLE